jgi:hypothetical protein
VATDIATLAIKVENGDVVKATSSLNTMAVAGGKTEAATQRLTRRMALLEIEARQMDAAMVKTTTTTARLAPRWGSPKGRGQARERVRGVQRARRRRLHRSQDDRRDGGRAGGDGAARSRRCVHGRGRGPDRRAARRAVHRAPEADDVLGRGGEGRGSDAPHLRQDPRARTSTAPRSGHRPRDAHGGRSPRAAVQVGKALQDPTTGSPRSVGRACRSRRADRGHQSLYDTGRAAEGQRVILKELEHQFGGSAAAARDTLGGALGAQERVGRSVRGHPRGVAGTVTAINAITHALENSGLSMNKILKDATVDWETMRASIEKVRAIMALQIDPSFLQNARNIIERIDFDLSTKIARSTRPRRQVRFGAPPPIGPTSTTKQAAKDSAELQKATDKYYNDAEPAPDRRASRRRRTCASRTRPLREMIAAMLKVRTPSSADDRAGGRERGPRARRRSEREGRRQRAP